MNDIELLRKAAALMRERAEAATRDGRWYFVPGDNISEGNRVDAGELSPVVGADYYDAGDDVDLYYIAGMDPTVALAVAKLLDATAHAWQMTEAEEGPGSAGPGAYDEEIALARAYLRLEEE